MERLPDELLMAYADGALDEAEMQRVAAILEANPAEQARLSPYVVTRDVLAGMFCEALTSPVPDRLIGTVLSTPVGTQASQTSQSREGQIGSRALGPSLMDRIRDLLLPEFPNFASAAALAATVAVIAGAGWLAGHASLPATSPQGLGSDGVVALDGDTVFASGALRTALDTIPSNNPYEQGLVKVTPVLTFRDEDDRICRQYTLTRAAKAAYAGYACRTPDGRWSVAFHAAEPADLAAKSASSESNASVKSSEGEFAPAGAPEFAALEGAIDRSIQGDALSGKDEAKLIADGWNDKGKP